jgi:two-component system phosphate regulon sensor histidine kinase PhoR
VFTAGIMTIIQQKRLSIIKSDFISNMTHELKTPLATISLAADTINSSSVLQAPDKIKYFTGIIKEENQRMNGHIERVLQMALLDKDEFRLKKCTVNLVEVVLEQGEYISLSVAEKGGKLEVDIQEDILEIEADKLQIQSLLTNLLDNALKYADSAPEIMIKLVREGNFAVLSVKDNGIGISAKAQKKIFDRFYRVTDGDLHTVKGFGLGLSFVKAITEAHGGNVSVESTIGKGSIFNISLPLISENA